ncbi:TetR/AcrR family transcriptional regulator [Kribbella sp. NPDC055071]
MPAETKRGPYAKGLARRAQILEAALKAYAYAGPQGPSLRSIAESVNLTEAGVLHYFGSKEELFVEILRARDEADAAAHDMTTFEGVTEIIESGMRTPGLIKLLLEMVAASTSPEHPAHAFMQERSAKFKAIVARLYEDGDPWKGRIALAATEGLMAQWLRDPSFDVMTDLRRLNVLLQDAPR